MTSAFILYKGLNFLSCNEIEKKHGQNAHMSEGKIKKAKKTTIMSIKQTTKQHLLNVLHFLQFCYQALLFSFRPKYSQ